LGTTGKSLIGKIWLTGHSLNKSAVWNITKATMHILLERYKSHKLAAS